jgi:hypothetical protein
MKINLYDLVFAFIFAYYGGSQSRVSRFKGFRALRLMDLACEVSQINSSEYG